MQIDPPRFITISEIAEKYAVTPGTVRGWLRRGEIPPEHYIRLPSGAYRIRPSLIAWFESPLRRQDGTPFGR